MFRSAEAELLTVYFTRDLLAFIIVFSEATNVIGVDMGLEFLCGIWGWSWEALAKVMIAPAAISWVGLSL